MAIVIVIVVAVIIVAAIAAWFTMAARRRRLRQRFGPEYERLTNSHDSKRQAESELTQRERRVAYLDIRPLSPEAQARYRADWTVIQQRFVETPPEALNAATRLIGAVMADRGYPSENYDQMVADLSVEHAHTISRFRAAHEISTRAAAGGASTEDMRQAMINYRTLFQELVSDGGEAESLPGTRAYDGRVTGGVSQGDAPATAAVDDPVAQSQSQQRSPRR